MSPQSWHHNKRAKSVTATRITMREHLDMTYIITIFPSNIVSSFETIEISFFFGSIHQTYLDRHPNLTKEEFSGSIQVMS